MEQLRRWIPAISNHLWWAAATCQNDAVLLKEKWISVLLHTSNVHTWTSATKFMKCAHDDLDPTDDKEWLVPGYPQHEALHKIMVQSFAGCPRGYIFRMKECVLALNWPLCSKTTMSIIDRPNLMMAQINGR